MTPKKVNLLSLLGFFWEILSLGFSSPEDQILSDFSSELGLIRDEYLNLKLDLVPIESLDSLNQDLNLGIEAVLEESKKFQSKVLIHSADFEEISSKNFEYFNDHLLIYFEENFKDLFQIQQDVLNRITSSSLLVSSTLEQLILADHTSSMYNLSRLIEALPQFKNNIVIEDLGKLISNSPNSGGVRSDNFFAKIKLRPLLYEFNLSSPSKEVFDNHREILKELLKNRVVRYK